jgi:RNA polymerase sigma-70 factor (ECF subfamily)
MGSLRPEVTATGEQFDGVLEAARAGADWAWRHLYEGLAPSVLGYLRSRGAPDPDGVCGEVFCQLVRDIHRFEGDESGFRSWVFVIAHHRLLDDLRRRSRRPETPADPMTMVEHMDGADVEAEVLARGRAEELRAMIDELTPAQRDVLLLRIYGDLTVEEVAKAVGRRPGAVKALQRRAIESVRRKLRDPDVSL